MPSRRTLLKAGFAAYILPRAIPTNHKANVAPRVGEKPVEVHHIYRVVSDRRFAQSVAFSLEAERLGAVPVQIVGDITELWFNDLSLRWKERPYPIAGLTAYGPIFCLERLAWDYGLRVVFRSEHQVLDQTHVQHSVTGPPAAVARASFLASEDSDWGRRVARLVLACELGRHKCETATMTSLSYCRSNEPQEPLTSWVIA